MDVWESSIEEYQQSQTLASLASVLHTAEVILKEDLAPFELDWFIQTLLSEPVSLLDVVSVRVTDDAWSKLVKDAYKLLSDLIDKHYDAMQLYVDAIIQQCQSPHDARLRSHALHCLTSCVKRVLPEAFAPQYIAELGNSSTCKAPLALLVGVVCEFHPEALSDHDRDTIWRKYLNLLESNKNSDQICKSLLKGVWCLFKHFGSDIQMCELNGFYDKLTKEYLLKCESAVLAILRDYASLFKERLSEDSQSQLRRELWTFEDLTPILPVYEQVASVLSKQQLQKIFLQEIASKTTERYSKLRFTALRVCILLRNRGVCVGGALNVDVYALEYELRREVSYDVAEAVSCCIECNMVNSEKVLQTAILFYHNLPASRRQGVVVDGLLNAPTDVMQTTLNFLINTSCQDDNSLHSFLPLWRDIFHSQLIEKRRLLFDMYIDYVLLMIDNFLDDLADDKKIPDKLANLLSLTSHVLALQPVDDMSDRCALVSSKLLEMVEECGFESCLVAVVRAVTPHLDQDCSLEKIYEMIQIDKCKDEALLCESCLALIQAPTNSTDFKTILNALEVIFSRKDAEPKTLSLAIHKLEDLIVKESKSLNKSTVSKCIQLIEKLRTRKDMIGKDARILQRDVSIFLGKYLNLKCVNDVDDSENNMLIVKLKDVLTLDISNPKEGITYKMNLNRLLHLAVTSEQEDCLKMFLNIICASLCNNNSPLLQAALGRGIVSLCRASVGTSRPEVARHAASFCDVDATLYIIQQLSIVKSPAVRRMLAETVETILLKDPSSEHNERILNSVYGQVCSMMRSENSTLKLGGLDITESLLTSLKVNRHQTQRMLPTLITLIPITYEQDTHTVFETASQLFTENIGLFSADVLDSTLTDILKTILNSQEIKPKIYKDIVKSVLKFACGIVDSPKITQLIFEVSNSDSDRFVYLWSEVPKAFELKEELMKEIFDFGNGLVLDKVFDNTDIDTNFSLEVRFRFINQYASVLFKLHNAATLKHISSIIEKLPPKYVRSHRKHLSECLTRCRQICQNTPNVLLKSFENWSEGLPLKDITEYIEKEKILPLHAVSVNALINMIEIFKLKNLTSILTTVSMFAKTWAHIVLKLYASERWVYLKKEGQYLSDLLSVSLSFLTVTDVKNILKEGHSLEGAKNANLGVDFCRSFMPVFLKYLVKKPFLLMQDGVQSCCVLLNDIVKWCVRKRWRDEQLENVLELVDQLWITYETKDSFKQKYTLLLDLSCLNIKLATHSRPMRWVTAVVGDNNADKDERIALVTVLPGGSEYCESYRRFASLLPTRLSDAGGDAALRALLDALAGTADDTLLDIVFTLADGDDTAGWWDEALASCMASLASLASLPLLVTLASRCRRASPVACRRLLVPLLRCSPSSVCEQFFASTLKEALGGLTGSIRPPSTHSDYKTCVEQKTIILDMLQVLFEKVSPTKIESPSSPLYANIQTDKPWHIAREVIAICYKLRERLVPPDRADTKLSRVCREFQYAAYKCMCACVCVRRPDAKIYDAVFNVGVWTRIVDETVVYDLPLKAEWNRHKLLQAVSVFVTGGGRRSRGSTRSASRSRLFLRTLSENPLQYDLIDHDIDDVDTQDIELTDSSLNQHPCASTLTALCQHAATLPHYEWRSVLCEALVKAPRNVRWLLAEVVCNSKEDMLSHAAELRPALLAVVADTSEGGLNSLHIDILNTLAHWGPVNVIAEVSNLNKAVEALVKTALNNATRKNIFKMLEDVLENMLRTYGVYVEGDVKVFEESFDDPNRSKSCLKLLSRFSKNDVRIPSLLPCLLDKLSENYKLYKGETSLIAELIGIEISNSSSQDKMNAFGQLKNILKTVKDHSKTDYVKIIHYSGCCDEQQFKTIVDLTNKLPADKNRCLHIISRYIREHPDSPELDNIPAEIRGMAEQISVDKQFEDLFTSTPQFLMPPAKRVKAEITSPILSSIGRNEKYISDVLARFGGKGRKGAKEGKIDEKLCKENMAVRFVECFYIAMYLPIKYQCDKTDLSVCMSEFFRMLFSHLKSQDIFKEKKLRDEPWVVTNPIGLSKTRTKGMVGTLRSFAYNTPSRDVDNDTDRGIDVQVSIEKILDTFIQFAKVSPEASMELLTQLLRCLVGREFDPRAGLSTMLSSMLTIAPELVILARNCVDHLYMIDGFVDTVDKLRRSTLGSEGEQLFRLLHEETKLRCGGSHLFVLGTTSHDDEDISMKEDADFSIEGLVSAFQKLSNWDEVTYQERRKIEAKLPILWTERGRFQELLDNYTDSTWFGEMVQLYRNKRNDVMKWLRVMDKWPRRHFLASSVVEAMQWHSVDMDINTLNLPCEIEANDCLAEWAARLMIRAAFLDKMKCGMSQLSRSHELRWCESANERGLHHLATSVIKRNYLDLQEHETLLWLEQKMLASSELAFKLSDRSQLEKTLQTADYFPEYCAHATPETILGVNKLIMQLNYRLESLTSSKIDDIMGLVEAQASRLDKRDISIKNKRNIANLYETAVLYYDGLWDKDELSKDEILVKMSVYLGRLFDQNIDVASVAAVILNRLDACDVIDDFTASTLLSKFKPVIPGLPSCYIDLLRRKIHLFPAHIRRSCGIAELQGKAMLDKYKKWLQLLCHADYLLLQFCKELHRALVLNDTSKWEDIFERINGRIFENEFAGTDFQALSKYKSTFNTLQAADPEQKRIILKGVIQELLSLPVRETVRLSHVCPSLAGMVPRGLERLLGLQTGVLVHKIDEELRVFTDSERRPCVVTLVTCDGRRRRYLHKNEDLRADAAVNVLTKQSGYTVIPLSEDCGLIEFLEEHKRVRDLISSTCNIDEIPVVRQVGNEDELVLSPRAASEQNFSEICSKVPAYSLRSAIETHSSSVQDFICKKQCFLETLTDMTIVNWLFGLADRHLQNILYSIQDGGVRCIDWGAIFQYGGELPPARLTRNLIAVCDPAVLESGLQNKLSSLRDSQQLTVSRIKLSFKWMDNFNTKLIYIEGILQGKMLSQDISKDVLQKSNRVHKEKYIQLLNNVFEKCIVKEEYTVEEQVSCLLRQCTDPWILSVTRNGWEPWL